MLPGETTGGRAPTSFVGDILPGGLNGRFDGESGREVTGVLGRDSLILDAGRIGGGIEVSTPTKLGLLPTGDGQGEIWDNVSIVLSDNEGRGRRLSLNSAPALSLALMLGFSFPSSNTGNSEFNPGGVVSKDAFCASRRASLTGETLLGRSELSDQPYRALIEWLNVSTSGVFAPAGRGSVEFLRKSSL